jgi:hypothetical protein
MMNLLFRTKPVGIPRTFLGRERVLGNKKRAATPKDYGSQRSSKVICLFFG